MGIYLVGAYPSEPKKISRYGKVQTFLKITDEKKTNKQKVQTFLTKRDLRFKRIERFELND